MKLRFESCSMSALVCEEVAQLSDHIGGSPASEPALSPVYANSAVLAGMIDLHHPVAQRFANFEPGSHTHAPTSHGNRTSAIAHKRSIRLGVSTVEPSFSREMPRKTDILPT